MISATSNDHLTYNIYTNGTYSSIYGDGTSSTTTYFATADGTVQNSGVYFKVDANQYVTPDNYSDTITVTVNY